MLTKYTCHRAGLFTPLLEEIRNSEIRARDSRTTDGCVCLLHMREITFEFPLNRPHAHTHNHPTDNKASIPSGWNVLLKGERLSEKSLEGGNNK